MSCEKSTRWDLLTLKTFNLLLISTDAGTCLQPRFVIAVDVENKDEEHLRDVSKYGDYLSGRFRFQFLVVVCLDC